MAGTWVANGDDGCCGLRGTRLSVVRVCSLARLVRGIFYIKIFIFYSSRIASVSFAFDNKYFTLL